jgi:hypothetical protein
MRGSTSSLWETPFTFRLIAFFMSYLTFGYLIVENFSDCELLCHFETKVNAQSNRRFVNASFQTVDTPPDDLELSMIVGRQRGFALRLQLPDARFDGALVNPDDVVMLVLNAKRLSERCDQVLLIHLRVTLDHLAIVAFCYVPQFCKRFVFQFFVCVRHRQLL